MSRYVKAVLSSTPTGAQRLKIMTLLLSNVTNFNSYSSDPVIASYLASGTVTTEVVGASLPSSVVSESSTQVIMRVGALFYKLVVSGSAVVVSIGTTETNFSDKYAVTVNENEIPFILTGYSFCTTFDNNPLFYLYEDKLVIVTRRILTGTSPNYYHTMFDAAIVDPASGTEKIAQFGTSYGVSSAPLPPFVKDPNDGISRKPLFKIRVYDSKQTYDLAGDINAFALAYDGTGNDIEDTVATGDFDYQKLGNFLFAKILAVFKGTSSTKEATPVTFGPVTGAAIGGKVYSLLANGTFYEYNIFTKEWVQLPNGLAFTGSSAPALAVYEDKLYCYKNGAVNVFDPVLGTWDYIAPVDTATAPMLYNNACGIIDNKLYIFSGSDGRKAYGAPSNETWVLDLNTRVWTKLTVTGSPGLRFGHIGGVIDGKFYIQGGYSGSSSGGTQYGDIRCFDPATNTWTLIANSSTRYNHAGCVSGECIYMHGGTYISSGVGTYVSQCYEYNVITKRSRTLVVASSIAPRVAHYIAVYEDKMYICGGDANNYAGAGNEFWTVK